MNETVFDVDVIASSGSAILLFVDGVTIHRRGDEGRCAYIVKRGKVALRHKGRPVETIGPGEIFGETSMIVAGPRLETAVAVGDVELLPIDQDLFDVLLRDDEEFAATVMKILVRRLGATAELFDRCIGDLPAAVVTVTPVRASA